MTENSAIKTLIPRFYWGFIGPRKPEYVRGAGYQFYRIVPLDVVVIETGLGIKEYTREAVELAGRDFWNCVELLKSERVDRITLGGVPVSIGLGRPKVQELLAAVEDQVGVPADAPLEALIASMQHLGLTRLAIGSRWDDEVNGRLVQYLKEGGIEVVGVTTRRQWAKAAHEMSLEDGLQVALDVGREAASLDSNAEAIFVPGGAAMALHVIPLLEEEFGKPTFTNLNAEVWNGLVRTGVIDPVEGWGQLLASK